MFSRYRFRRVWDQIKRRLPDGDPGVTGPTGPPGPAGPAGVWPIGAIFIAVVSTNPATLLGYGTWTAFGAGRVLVGHNAADADFDTAEETGGAKTHTLTSSEMPSHTHAQDAHSHTIALETGVGLGLLGGGAATGSSSTSSVTATNQSTGGGAAHNNMPPYVVAYLWKRTA